MKSLILIILSLVPPSAFAKIRVVATSADIGAIAREVAGDQAEVSVIAKGSQNLHSLEAKPSFMMLMNRADLIVANGLGLEVGWLPAAVRGARNPKINPGSIGYLELGPSLNPIEVPKGSLTRAEGDVHPEGNPHWTLDPVRVGDGAEVLAKRMGQLDPSSSAAFNERAKALKQRLLGKVEVWKKRLTATNVKKVITYHKTLNYFLERFGIEGGGYLEPKPGIPPSAQHILEVATTAKAQKIPLILVEHYYDVKIAERIATDVPTTRVASVPASVEANPEVKSLDDLYEQIVKVIEGGKS